MRILTDNYGRVHDYLRISLTDRCNLNCIYCNPRHGKTQHIAKEEILSYENILRLIKIFAVELGFKKFRFTGGEPLARKNVIEFFKSVNELKRKYYFQTAITTNGSLLSNKLSDLKKYGIDNINISLDSLKQNNFKNITGKDNFNNVIEAIQQAKQTGFNGIKINCVVMKDVNDSEIVDFTDFAVKEDINIRFIEYMPFSNNSWNKGSFISSAKIKKIIENKYVLEEIPGKRSVSKDYRIKENKGTIGFISSISNHFCNSCSRLRITAKGSLRLCLFSEKKQELNLKNYLREHSLNDFEIAEEITAFVKTKSEKHPAASQLVKLDYNYMLRSGG